MAIVVPIVSEWNPKGVERSIADIKKADGAWSKTGAAFKAAFVPAAAALGGVVAIGIKTAGMASDLNEVVSKTGVIFGDAASQVRAFAKTSARDLGMSEVAALNAASTFATFGKAAGLAGPDLASFSTDLTGLAADLASFHNTSPEDAITAIGAALRGESEPMRKYGVLLDDASLRQQALAMGLIKTTKTALTPQQKALAAQALILKQTTDAQGDFARTSDGAANKQRILSATMADAGASVGSAFLPIMEAVVPLLSQMAAFAGQNGEALGKMAIAIGVVAGAIVAVNAAMKVYQAVMIVSTAVTWAMNAAWLANPIVLIVLAIIAVIVLIGAALVLLWKKNETFRNVVTAVWQAVWGFIQKVWGWLVALFKITPFGFFITNLGLFKDAFFTVFNAIWSFVEGIVKKIGDLIGGLVDKIRGLMDGIRNVISKIPGLSSAAQQAVVPTLGAGTFAAGGSTQTTQVTVNGASDPDGVARQLRRVLGAQDARQGRTYGAPRAAAW